MNSNPSRRNCLYCAISILVLLVIFFPVYWIIVTSLKTEQEIFLTPPTFFPQKLNFDSYRAQLAPGTFNMFR
jgi:multiple sugar transport system permease protein